jgi:N6-L-threonylcarbamoyladenine synthase
LNTVLVTGGVACNERLRAAMGAAAREAGLRVLIPSPALCTDNAAMVAGLGWHLLRAGRSDGLALDASPR